jgi:hypothetical protein
MLEHEVQQMCHWAAEMLTPKQSKGKPVGLPFAGMGGADFRLLVEALRALHIDGYSEERDVKQLLSLVSLSSDPLQLPLVVREQADGDLCVMTDTLEIIVEVETRSRKGRTWTIVIASKLRTSFKETLRQTKLQQQTKKDQAEPGPG